GRQIELTAKEYALLEYLARRAGEVVSRAEIAEHVWEENFDPFSNLIEVYVQRLRRKIDEVHALKLLRTRRGEGFMMNSGKEDSVVGFGQISVGSVLRRCTAPGSGFSQRRSLAAASAQSQSPDGRESAINFGIDRAFTLPRTG